jgi:hypothetical protein
VRRAWVVGLLVARVAAAQAGGGGGGGTLPEAAQAARQAWLSHDVQALVGASPNLVLQIPGADPSSPLGRAQAGELLRRYLRPVAERSLEIGRMEVVEEGKGFVELDRRYVVLGTNDLRRERLFLGFARLAGRWVLTELRSAP